MIVRKSQTSNIWVNADTALSRYVKKYSTHFNRKDVCAHFNIYFRVNEQRHIVNRLRSRQPLFLFLKKGIKYIDLLESITFTLRLYYDFQQTYCFFHESKQSIRLQANLQLFWERVNYNISKITILKCNIEKPAEYGRLINLIFQQSSNNTFVIRKKGRHFDK